MRMCQTPSKTQTDGQTDKRTRDASLSVVPVSGVHPMRNKPRCFVETEGGGGKNPGSTNKYTKFVQLIVMNIVKFIATICHILRLKCTKFDFWCLLVRSFRLLDGVWHDELDTLGKCLT